MNEQEIIEKINDLDNQYAEQKTKFDQWKKENTRQMGTEAYNAYVKQVEDWQKTVLTHRHTLQQKLTPTVAAGPVGPEVMMEQMLDDVKPMQYLIALMTMGNNDPTFLKAVLHNYKNLKGSSARLPIRPSVSVPVMQTPVVGVNSAPSAVYAVPPTANYTVPPPTHFNVPPPNIAPGVSTAPVAYTYAPPVVVPTNQASTFPTQTQKIQKIPTITSDRYRAPSPVRDYNTVSTPFLDFSMK